MTTKTPPLQEKMEDLARASTLINQAVKSCSEWDHYDLVAEAIDQMREAQKSLKRQFEEWSKTSRRLGSR